MQLAVLLSLPLLGTGAIHNHAKLHKRGHAIANRAVQVEVDVVTITQIVTVTVDTDAASATTSVAAITPSSAPNAPAVILTSMPSSRPDTSSSQSTSIVAETPAAPPNDGSGGNPFKALDTVPSSAMIKNSCEYPVYIWSEGNSSCEGPEAKCKLIEANGTHVEPLRKCPDGGISLKISKSEDPTNPMQFEYSVWPDHKTVSYDISYLNCMTNGKDLSQCAGHDGGIQVVGGGDCKDFFCAAGQSCNAMAYTVAEFDYQPNAPVGGCEVDKGIAFELCAGLRT